MNIPSRVTDGKKRLIELAPARSEGRAILELLSNMPAPAASRRRAARMLVRRRRGHAAGRCLRLLRLVKGGCGRRICYI